MSRTTARHAGRSFGLRTVAALLLTLLFGLQFGGLAVAQAARTPDCCMAAEGKGCSMHLHRAAQARRTGHTLASLQPQCPCTPMAPAGVAAHGAVSLAAAHLQFVLAAGRAVAVQLRSLQSVAAADRGGTRGPPALTLAA